jgi:glycosyltransferase involved in cell wall biosynthesis
MKVMLVEGWPMESQERRDLMQRISSTPNVSLWPTTSDMRKVYERTWMLLVPSELETFGRVVVEAQASGIPVATSSAGALPWVVGEGGRVFSGSQTAADWAEWIKTLWNDRASYVLLSEKATKNSQRPEFDADRVISSFDEVLSVVQRAAPQFRH